MIIRICERERETIEDGEICSSRRNAVASDLSLLLLLALDCVFQTPILLVLPSTGVLHKRRFASFLTSCFCFCFFLFFLKVGLVKLYLGFNVHHILQWISGFATARGEREWEEEEDEEEEICSSKCIAVASDLTLILLFALDFVFVIRISLVVPSAGISS